MFALGVTAFDLPHPILQSFVMKMGTLCLAALLSSTSLAAAEKEILEMDTVCVRNASANKHLFVAEAPNGRREIAELAPGGMLCVSGAEAGETGVVSVFEDQDAFEGCSRLVPAGRTEDMIKYVDFDRCFWSSNS
ncbi:hypothetical protein [Roseovarius sp. D0-M9]|uniref:hypothetical protein n=1 Tax=Roseovarius sp. D0-M9 TaxID=3127117 RepID=UPI003010054A